MQGLASLADAAAAAAAAAHDTFGDDCASSEAESEAAEDEYVSCASLESSVSGAGCESASEDEDIAFPQDNAFPQELREVCCLSVCSNAFELPFLTFVERGFAMIRPTQHFRLLRQTASSRICTAHKPTSFALSLSLSHTHISLFLFRSFAGSRYWSQYWWHQPSSTCCPCFKASTKHGGLLCVAG